MTATKTAAKERPSRAGTAMLLAAIAASPLAACRTVARVEWRPLEQGGPARPVERAEELLQHVVERNDGYGTLRARAKISLELELGPDKSEKLTASALLRVHRPGHFRLELRAYSGELLFDLVGSRGRHRVLYVAPALLAPASALSDLLPVLAADLRHLLRLDPQPSVERRAVEETVSLASGSQPLFEIREYGRGEEPVRRWTVFAASLAVARMEVSDEGGERTITFGDYETDGRIVIPRSFHLARVGQTFYWLSCTFEELEVDAKLDGSIFDFGPAGAREP
jgi:hypothetical protein